TTAAPLLPSAELCGRIAKSAAQRSVRRWWRRGTQRSRSGGSGLPLGAVALLGGQTAPHPVAGLHQQPPQRRLALAQLRQELIGAPEYVHPGRGVDIGQTCRKQADHDVLGDLEIGRASW